MRWLTKFMVLNNRQMHIDHMLMYLKKEVEKHWSGDMLANSICGRNIILYVDIRFSLAGHLIDFNQGVITFS